MLKKDLLKKMKMPEKAQDPMLSMDQEEMDMGAEAPDEMPMEDMPAPAEGPMAEIPDEELIAEFKKRGLTPEDLAEQEQQPADEEMPLEDMPEDEEEMA